MNAETMFLLCLMFCSYWRGWKDNGAYTTIHFSEGDQCWNGPQRSVAVKLKCGAENKLLSVTEPSKCEYVMEFDTPAACPLPSVEYEYQHDDL